MHLLVDCRQVPSAVCLDDGAMLRALAEAAHHAGANVISQVRYRFGSDSPPGYTAAVILDESHCTAHSYAEHRAIAIDIFTCGATDPRDVLSHLQSRIDLGEVTVSQRARFGDGAHGGGRRA